jgi:hypothetical protein
LTGLRIVPYPTAHMLCVEFADPAPLSVKIMYGSSARTDFESIMAALQSSGRTNGITSVS